MTAKLFSLNELKSDNFKIEHELTYENRKMLTKMFRYIDTFPLKEYEVELIRKDLIGMALEAECRQESFRDTLGKKPKDFCDDIICASTDYKVPGGRKYLRIASGYCYAIGCYYLMLSGFVLILALCLFPFPPNAFNFQELLDVLILAVPGILYGLLYLKAGTAANIHSGNPLKADVCLRYGILTLAAYGAITVYNYIYEQLSGSQEIAGDTSVLNIIGILLCAVQIIFPLLYLFGAYKNKKDGQTIL